MIALKKSYLIIGIQVECWKWHFNKVVIPLISYGGFWIFGIFKDAEYFGGILNR